ncbi:DUF6089 family protein [Flaviaesturariibacter aridisoli]|uniref:DUF6089 domain-containing protein n=1 Tax=Flaviaesturariibacter aridisoli TaxID=2545761 RepID=A0A4R4E1B6_9BACT|nr:DUF6089 family protein [Flaviaesturariibacter aridisoli]TCZ73264.1 hypothetical protein E0486_06210 [Flaviaesturariibacter aridisoli]
MRSLLTVFGLLILSVSFAQSPLRIGLFGGVSQYQGDLQSSVFQSRFARGAFGLTASYDLAPRLALRAGLTLSGLEASDRYNTKEELRVRNFSFASKLVEASLVGQYTFFNLDDTRWSPYVFGGVAVFRMNPYTYDSGGQKWYLMPLGTEGQGLEQYPDRKAYHLTQFAIPFGGGITYALTERWQLGLELGLRKTFTDYIDDVSGTYADANDLMATRGAKSVELAFRRPEVDPGAAYPQKGSMRGNSKNKDLYYFTGLHLQFRLGSGGGSTKRYGCPKVSE